MQNACVAWAKQACSFPAIFFWLAFIGIPAGLISGLIFSAFEQSRFLIPTLVFLLSQPGSFLVRAGLLTSFAGLCVVAYVSHNFYSKILTRVSPQSEFRNTMRAILVIIDISISLHVLCLFLIAIISFNCHKAIFSFLVFLYLVSGVTFHMLVDHIATKLRTYVPISNGLSICAVVLVVSCGLVFSIGSGLEGAKGFAYGLASLFQYGAMLILSLKILFVGVNILGGQFLPGIARKLTANNEGGYWKPGL